MSPACSVVIPTYNAAATLGEQLTALAAQEGGVSFDVIIADNGSTDDSAHVAAAWTECLDLRVVDASSRRGPSAARNIGAQYARSPLLLFCDADDVVGREWVRTLVEALASSPFVGGPCHPFSSRSGIWLPGYGSDGLPVAWDDWEYAFAGNFGITKEAWLQVGGFDETLTGAEEIEFAWRARNAGIQPEFAAAADIKYRVRSSLRGRLWHEYNSGRGTAMLARRLFPDRISRRSWKSQVRHIAILVSRFPRTARGASWASWAAVLAFEAGSRAGSRTT